MGDDLLEGRLLSSLLGSPEYEGVAGFLNNPEAPALLRPAEFFFPAEQTGVALQLFVEDLFRFGAITRPMGPFCFETIPVEHALWVGVISPARDSVLFGKQLRAAEVVPVDGVWTQRAAGVVAERVVAIANEGIAALSLIGKRARELGGLELDAEDRPTASQGSA